ncbi:GNAT family N-acetyltransferase [Paucibacter sp. KBW04]|uniref:GNAT family N-acetyltransferase n=1 Tax=Paucibacter sp. KBW04 TaxID=2153361 RepID=UPI0026972E55
MSIPTSFDGLELHTERMVLRGFAEQDAQAVLPIYADPEVMRYGSRLPWTSISQAHEFIAQHRAWMAEGSSLRLAMFSKEDGVLLGDCSLFNWQRQCRRAEIGYGLARAAWHRGFMGEALQALLAYGFGTMDLNRVEADIDPRNKASAKTLERLGFRQEGLLPQRWIVGEEVSDSALYGLLRSDWEMRSNQAVG